MGEKIVVRFCVIFGIVLLIIGVLFIGVGCVGDNDYEENSIECVATITDINSKTVQGETGNSYEHRYYGSYVINDKTYTDVQILYRNTDSKTPKYSVGETITIRVDSDNPSQLAKSGKGFYVGSGIVAGCGLFFIICGIWVRQHNIKRRIEKAE